MLVKQYEIWNNVFAILFDDITYNERKKIIWIRWFKNVFNYLYCSVKRPNLGKLQKFFEASIQHFADIHYISDTG